MPHDIATIQVRVGELRQLFNSIDPSPISRARHRSRLRWVVMWHPLEVLLYGLWPLVRERRLLERLASASVVLHTPEKWPVAPAPALAKPHTTSCSGSNALVSR